jgi:hypothetical protein
MNEPKDPAAAKMNETAASRPHAAPAPAPASARAAAAIPAAGDLDLSVDEIQRPELMKEGFVGQER